MNKDLHPELGIRHFVPSLEEALARVRALHPTAYMEGSTGAERSFWVAGRLVAHAWPKVGRRPDAFWLRVSDALASVDASPVPNTPATWRDDGGLPRSEFVTEPSTT